MQASQPYQRALPIHSQSPNIALDNQTLNIQLQSIRLPCEKYEGKYTYAELPI